MNTIIWIIVVLLILAGIGFGVWALLRYRYVKSLRDRGWTFVTSPDETVAYGLNVPPFGVGIGRTFDDLVAGEIDGWQFEVFEYKSNEFAENRITTIRLPRPLGEFQMHLAQLEPGAAPQPQILAESDDWAATVHQALQPAMAQITAGASTKLSIDGDRVVLQDTPEKPDAMEAHIRRAIAAAQAVSAPGLGNRTWPDPPRHLGFHRTDWRYEVRNDAALRRLQHSSGGFDHTAVDVITGPNDGLPFTALEHKWKTRETYTDSEGRTKTRTVHHDEILMEVHVPFPFSMLSVNWGFMSGGEKRQFESITFDKMFNVRSAHPKFAHDVLHPRTMQWMESMGETEFRIDEGRWVWKLGSLHIAQIQWRLDYCHTFFSMIPDFVYEDLGLHQRPNFRQVMR